MASPSTWEAELRAIAMDAGGGDVWLEKIKLLTRPCRRVAASAAASAAAGAAASDATGDATADADGPLLTVRQIIAEALARDEVLDSLKQELEPLFLKLPIDLREGRDAPFRSPRDFIRGLLGGIEPDIRHRLEDRSAGGSR